MPILMISSRMSIQARKTLVPSSKASELVWVIGWIWVKWTRVWDLLLSKRPQMKISMVSLSLKCRIWQGSIVPLHSRDSERIPMSNLVGQHSLFALPGFRTNPETRLKYLQLGKKYQCISTSCRPKFFITITIRTPRLRGSMILVIMIVRLKSSRQNERGCGTGLAY